MVVGIIAALPAEVEPLIKCFDVSSIAVVAGTRFYKAHMMGQELVFTAPGIGKVNAACQISHHIYPFFPILKCPISKP